jgi:hypothetical protein
MMFAMMLGMRWTTVILLGFVGVIVWQAFFWFGKDAAYKRRWFPCLLFLQSGLMFLMPLMPLEFMPMRRYHWIGMAIIAPTLGLSAYLQHKHTRFCDRCGGYATSWTWVTDFPNKCTRCGAMVDLKPPRSDDLLE